jgi:hypothetical protein
VLSELLQYASYHCVCDKHTDPISNGILLSNQDTTEGRRTRISRFYSGKSQKTVMYTPPTTSRSRHPRFL